MTIITRPPRTQKMRTTTLRQNLRTSQLKKLWEVDVTTDSSPNLDIMPWLTHIRTNPYSLESPGDQEPDPRQPTREHSNPLLMDLKWGRVSSSICLSMSRNSSTVERVQGRWGQVHPTSWLIILEREVGGTVLGIWLSRSSPPTPLMTMTTREMIRERNIRDTGQRIWVRDPSPVQSEARRPSPKTSRIMERRTYLPRRITRFLKHIMASHITGLSSPHNHLNMGIIKLLRDSHNIRRIKAGNRERRAPVQSQLELYGDQLIIISQYQIYTE